MKKWILLDPVPAGAFAAMPDLPKVLASVLWRRGIRTAEEAEVFLNPSWERDVHDPFAFADMRKAVARLLQAREAGEKVVIHGDYDADGVSGSVILHSTLKELGVDVSVYLPHREKEGYGLSFATVEKLAAEGAAVIVTCDCGISNGREIARAAELGLDVIVADHHALPPDPPPAHAILHPLREGEAYPFKYLTGGGVAFKLCQALWREAGLPDGRDKWLLDLAAISTVADMGKLVGENRALVHYGLLVLNKTRRLGLGKLVEAVRREGETLDAASIGFRIAPRINAAGRMDHANAAFALLTAETEDEAVRRVAVLNDRNRERQDATERILLEARAMAGEWLGGRAIVIAGDGWPAALCGLIAARLVDDHYRPVIVLGKTDDGRYVGSGRSIPGFDVTAALRACEAHLQKFGGHPMACGLTVADDAAFEAFREAFLAHAEEVLGAVELVPRLEIEAELAPADVTLGLAMTLRRLEPHGEGNPKPRFLLKGARAAAVQPVGATGKHLRLIAADARGGRLKLIGFGFGGRAADIGPGAAFEAVVEIDVNEWNGRTEPQGRLIDIRTATSDN